MQLKHCRVLQMSLLRIKDGSPMSVGDIVGSVESVEGKVQDACSACVHVQARCRGCSCLEGFCKKNMHLLCMILCVADCYPGASLHLDSCSSSEFGSDCLTYLYSNLGWSCLLCTSSKCEEGQ